MEYCKYGQIENIFYISIGGMESDQGRQRKQIMKGIQIMLIHFLITTYVPQGHLGLDYEASIIMDNLELC